MSLLTTQGIGTVFSRMEGYDSTLLAWVASPPFSASGPGGGSTLVSVNQLLDSSGGSITAGDSVNQAIKVNVVAGAAGGSTIVTVSAIKDSSGGGVIIGDSANNAMRVNVVAGAAGGSTIVSVAALPAGMLSTSVPAANSTGLHAWIVGGNRLNIGSTAADNAVKVSGDSSVVITSGNSSVRANLSSTSADNPVLATIGTNLQSTAVPAAGSSGLNVWVVGGNRLNIGSTAADNVVRATLSSTNTDNPVRAVLSSTSADNPVLATIGTNIQSTSVPAANSSGLNVWMVGGNRINIGSTATDNVVRATLSSTNTDNPVRAVLSSTTADNPVLATIGTNLQSSVMASSNSSGLVTRQIVDNILTVLSTNAFASSSFTIQSSAAGIRTYVTAYSILSTVAGPTKVKFFDGASVIWPMQFAAVSSAVSGANLAVSAPAYLFRGTAAAAMTLQVASSIAGFQVAVSYYRAP